MSTVQSNRFFGYQVDPSVYKRDTIKVEEFVPPEDFWKPKRRESTFRLDGGLQESNATHPHELLPHQRSNIIFDQPLKPERVQSSAVKTRSQIDFNAPLESPRTIHSPPPKSQIDFTPLQPKPRPQTAAGGRYQISQVQLKNDDDEIATIRREIAQKVPPLFGTWKK